MEKLFYQTSPQVTLATNIFVNVPIILQYNDTPLISVIKEQSLGFTTSIPIYHPDGTYLAKVNGTRIFHTDDGKKAGIKIRQLQGLTVCEMDGSTLFEIHHGKGDAFRTNAELHTPDGFFVKTDDNPAPKLISSSGETLRVGGVQMSGCMFSGCRVGIWLRSDGSCAIGCA